MAKFKVAMDHGMERTLVVERLVGFAEEMRDNVPVEVKNIEESWDSEGNLVFSFTTMGFKVSGEVVTCTTQVTVSGQLPFAALPFRGAIERAIAERLRVAIG